MMNLMEIMQAAQGGRAMQNLAAQFGVSPQQAQAAVQAVLPAMSAGLQRQSQSAGAMAQFLDMLSAGRHAAAFDPQDRDGDGVPDHLQRQGNEALGMMFGSKDVSRAVAGQAAQFAGLSDSMIKAMLPAIASMVMGGLFKGMNNQGFGGLLGQIASGFGQSAQTGAGAGGQGSLADMLGRMMTGGMMGGAQPAPTPSPQPAHPFGDMLGGVLNTMLGGAGAPSSASRPQPMPDPTPAAASADPLRAGLEALQGMFQTGVQAQQTQVDAFGKMFGEMLGGGRR